MKIYLVGGAVRDQLLGLRVKERDWVVVGAASKDLLKRGYQQVGKEFPVFLHPQTHEEYALARLEQKTDAGYKGFRVDTSPEVDLIEDLKRRDLTINAMAKTKEGELIDPYHGKEDLANKLLRHVSPAFVEDPVRILRVARFLARYAHLGFHVAPETLALMKHMTACGEVNALVPERVWKEWERALGEKTPEKFFESLADCGALAILFPELPLANPGMIALKKAAAVTQNTTVRFAALLYTLPQAEIKTLCGRYRIPTAYKELAILTALHYTQALAANQLSAIALLALFNALDVYRRESRFQHFLMACQAIAYAQQIDFADEWLKQAMLQVKAVDVKQWLSEGLSGEQLAVRLQHARLEKFETWLKS